jgi:integrase/recombinase XerD
MHTDEFIMERKYLKNVSPKTIVWYTQSFRAFEGAMESKAAIVTRIAELRDRGLSAISVNTYLRCVNAYLNWLRTEHNQPFLKIPRLKEEQKVIKTFSRQQVEALISFRPSGVNFCRVHVVVSLILDTGIRFSEALGMTWSRVDFDNLLLTVHGKGAKDRVIPFSFECRKILFKWKQKQAGDLVFCTRNGTKPTQRNCLRDMKAMASRLQITGVRVSPHTLRHTFAVNYIRSGGDVFRLQRVLGHSTLEMTRRYVNLQTADLQSVHQKLSLLGGREVREVLHCCTRFGGWHQPPIPGIAGIE